MDTDNRGVVHYEAKIYRDGKYVETTAGHKDYEDLETNVVDLYKGEKGISYDIIKVTTERELINFGKL